PADIIDKIQVFDKATDQAQFTGFDDGNAQKTINIITKKGKNNGQFGKIYAGGGTGDDITDYKYNAGGNMNFFNGARRISVVELSNNINQQNFSSQDLLGISGGSGGRGNAANNFLVSQQGGITTTHAAGLNYSDEWGKKIKVTGSYFFNYADNSNNSSLSRNYIIAKENGLHYNQVANAGNTNQNHRVNFRFEYTIDSMNSLIIVPKFSVQQNRSANDLDGLNLVTNNAEQSRTITNNYSKNFGYDFSNTLTLRHKFKKPRRTISLGVSTDYNPTNSNGGLFSSNAYYQYDTTTQANDSTMTILNQQSVGNNLGMSISPNLSYTEPLGKKSQLMLSYNPSVTKSTIDKRTYNKDSADGNYNLLDTILSNKYNNTYTYQRGGLSYRYTDKKMNFMLGANVQYATLNGTEQFPYALAINKNFESVLPQMMFNYKFSKTKNLRITYRTNTSPPSISQLQNVINNSNPLLLSTGNPNLKQDYENTINLRYGSVNSTKGTNFMVYAMANFIGNYVANSTLIPTVPTQVSSSVILRPGSQLTKPVNLNGYWNARSFLTYGFPLTKIKMNCNLNTGFTYNLIPDLINDQENLANNYNFSEGLVLSSNISQKVDFSLSYTGNYSIVKNTLQKQSDNNYFNQVTTFKFNWLPYKGIIFNTNLTHTLYTGLAQNYNQNYLLWNAAIGYKFLKSQLLDVRVSVFDMLKQNNSISRNVTDTYIEDSHTQVLTRYYMLTVTYTIKNFKNGGAPPTENTDKQDGFRNGGGPRNGGGGYHGGGGGWNQQGGG
ncbi:MAG TPA: outer membrane beta-barrel protein, partial [Bacteroidia bacterium]|nr:outer membrane beta-barrel protein [Bacteroidia bacterium]